MSDDGELIRNHPKTAGRWKPSDELQGLTRAELAPGDFCPLDEDPPRSVMFWEDKDGTIEFDDGDYPEAVCLDCVHVYDNRPLWRMWLDRLLRRTQPARSLFCSASPREDVYSPINGEIVYINSMFCTPSRGMTEPDERCQDVNMWGNCKLFKKAE